MLQNRKHIRIGVLVVTLGVVIGAVVATPAEAASSKYLGIMHYE